MTRNLWGNTMIGRFGMAIAGLAAVLASAGAARAYTQINSCPYTISSPGEYVLVANLTCSGDGIDITASNVDLKLNDHTITGPNNGSGYGINVSSSPSYTHINVQGPGLIQHFATGIYLVNVTNSRIHHLIAAGNGGGIYSVSGGANNHFEENNLPVNNGNSGRGDGITLYDTNSEVEGNDASGNLWSGIADFGSGNHMHHNNAVGNKNLGGLYVVGTNAHVHDNTEFGNAGGIIVGGGKNVIRDNIAEGNVVDDLYEFNSNCGTDTWQHNTFFTANEPCIH